MFCPLHGERDEVREVISAAQGEAGPVFPSAWGTFTVCVALKSVAHARKENGLGGSGRLSVFRATFPTGHGSGFVYMGACLGSRLMASKRPSLFSNSPRLLLGHSTIVTNEPLEASSTVVHPVNFLPVCRRSLLCLAERARVPICVPFS